MLLDPAAPRGAAVAAAGWESESRLRLVWEQALMELLDQQYPQSLLQQLRDSSQGAFEDAAAAFPNEHRPHSRSLRQFAACAPFTTSGLRA